MTRPKGTLPPAVVVGGTTAASLRSPVERVTSYVFARQTLLVLFGLGVITTVMRWMSANSWGLAGVGAAWIALGLEASYYFRIVESKAAGDDALATPDFSNLHYDIVGPAVRYVLSLAPVVVALAWWASRSGLGWIGFRGALESPQVVWPDVGPSTLLVASIVLWPLMTAIAAISRSVIAMFNPAVWWSTLRSFGMRYVIGATMFYALMAAHYYALRGLVQVVGTGFVALLAIQVVSILAFALRGAVLGVVCEPYFEQ